MLCCAATAQCAAGQHSFQYRPPRPFRPTVNQSPVPRHLIRGSDRGVSHWTPDTWVEKFESLERINSIGESNRSFDSCNSRKRLGYHPVPAAAAPPRRPVLDGSPAVYMSYMSQNFCLFPVSKLSVLNFRIFLLMYPGSVRDTPAAATNKVPGTGDWLTVGRGGGGGRYWMLCCPAAHWADAAQHNIQCWARRRPYGKAGRDLRFERETLLWQKAIDPKMQIFRREFVQKHELTWGHGQHRWIERRLAYGIGKCGKIVLFFF